MKKLKSFQIYPQQEANLDILQKIYKGEKHSSIIRRLIDQDADRQTDTSLKILKVTFKMKTVWEVVDYLITLKLTEIMGESDKVIKLREIYQEPTESSLVKRLIDLEYNRHQ